ncbi:MAG: hypothetical protein IPJ19_02080 [Planctomycetes bacterium]|nr:hypothetical protein [Planctomycetota bacterium]
MAADELAAALLPALLHKLNNVTQVIASVNSLARLTGCAAPLVQCASDLDLAGGELARLGWLVGALARGVGSGIGSPRHEERALEWLLDLLGETLRRDGWELAPGSEIPRVEPEFGFESSWAIASWILACAHSGAQREPLAFALERAGTALVLRTSRAPQQAEGLRTRLEALVPRSHLRYEVRT